MLFVRCTEYIEGVSRSDSRILDVITTIKKSTIRLEKWIKLFRFNPDDLVHRPQKLGCTTWTIHFWSLYCGLQSVQVVISSTKKNESSIVSFSIKYFILHWNRLVYINKINTWLYFWDVKCATAIFFLQTSGLFALPHFSWYKIGEKCHSKM